MSEANRDEAEKCKQVARAAASGGDFEKATRFLQKAKRMNPGDASIDSLLEMAANGIRPDGGGGSAPSSNEGPRFRPSSSSSARTATPVSSAPSSGPTRTNKSGGTYTPEQAKEVQRILRTKDYYDILGVPKDSSEETVKKAYKKLALKLHPDKNQAPGAEEAFKKVSKAAQCLQDGDKKQMYDRYGDEDRVPQSHRQAYQSDFMTPEDFFNAFFNGHVNGHHSSHHRSSHRQQSQDPNEVQGFSFQVLPVLLVLILMMATHFPGKSTSRFSFSPDSHYQSERNTGVLNVPYYVTNDFENHYAEGSNTLREFERHVDIYYVKSLYSECDYQEKQMYKKVMMAKRRNNPEDLEKARSQPRPACKEMDKIKRKHPSVYKSAMQAGY
eukprot:TRINITY_DN16331_c0_g1_i1.p1 TRINITY_DN16331_c0_g1~~TRINITY_DN16331_c0_g1_i1.p1  ORF type:complete len:384 (+),score=101.97 TRINITY_DN16331_c0_g1_i1:106-1257(+)